MCLFLLIVFVKLIVDELNNEIYIKKYSLLKYKICLFLHTYYSNTMYNMPSEL